MLGLRYKYWINRPIAEVENYELVNRRREFRTLEDAIIHFDLLKRTWGKNLVSVRLELDLYSSNFDTLQTLGV